MITLVSFLGCFVPPRTASGSDILFVSVLSYHSVEFGLGFIALPKLCTRYGFCVGRLSRSHSCRRYGGFVVDSSTVHAVLEGCLYQQPDMGIVVYSSGIDSPLVARESHSLSTQLQGTRKRILCRALLFQICKRLYRIF